ncbi:MAG: hypoxanthine phosphoribosyltransferase [Ruminococcaceae bacterium]|nr:hypoxanthine phosphoribosyltransferase [Oscillospiraceae bacterium]
MNNSIEKILFSEEEIREKVTQVGKKISEDYKGKNPVLVGILKGSVIFMADLMRAVDINCKIAFLSARSYGNNSFSSGTVQIGDNLKSSLGEDIEGKDIILVEDILDTAATLYAVREKMKELNPASIKICTFIERNIERKVDLKPDYKCFDIEDGFIVGYGLDYAQNYRNLPYVGILKPEIYTK